MSEITTIRYRPEIDGLRALAVALVLLVHFFPKLAPNGFIGVDIFFVISGYLITSILLTQLQTNQFSLREFYIRRANRIFPALILVLIACICFGWMAMFASEFKLLGRSIASGAGFVANINLFLEGGYWDISGKLKPLLHLWSLGVEEQFYIIWPSLLWALFRSRFNMFAVFIMLLFLSLGWNLYEIKINHEANFYLPFARFWELLAGGCAVYINHPLTFSKLSKKSKTLTMQKVSNLSIFHNHPIKPEQIFNILNNASAFFGLFLIFFSLFFLIPVQEFPGKYAIMPVLGTFFIIVANSTAWINSNLLSNQILVYVGLISFSLYMWHWPLLTFVRIIENGEVSNSYRNIALFITAIFSVATFHIIEKPIRNGSHNRGIKAIVLSATLFACGFSGYLIYTNDGYQSRYVKTNVYEHPGKSDGIESEDANVPIKKIPNLPVQAPAPSKSLFSTGTKVALIGDSNASRLVAGILPCYQNDLITFATPGWPYFVGTGYKPGYVPHSSQTGTKKLTEDSINKIISDDTISVVIIANMYVMYLYQDTLRSDPGTTSEETSSQAYAAGLRRTVKLLTGSGKIVVYVKTIPFLDGVSEVSACLSSSLAFKRKMPEGCIKPLEYVKKQRADYDKIVEDALEGLQVSVFDTLPYFCDRHFCYAARDGVLMYLDMSHLSDAGSHLIGPRLVQFIQDARSGRGDGLSVE